MIKKDGGDLYNSVSYKIEIEQDNQAYLVRVSTWTDYGVFVDEGVSGADLIFG